MTTYIDPKDWDMFRKLVNYYRQTGKVDNFLKNTCKLYGFEVEQITSYKQDDTLKNYEYYR